MMAAFRPHVKTSRPQAGHQRALFDSLRHDAGAPKFFDAGVT